MPEPADAAGQPSQSEIVIANSTFKDFAELAKSFPDKPFMRSNCKLCMSKYRAEAEEMFARDGNMLKVHRMLHDKGESISHPAVANHLKNHYKRPHLQEQLKEYADDMESWSKIHQDKKARAREHIAILERRIRYIEATTDESCPNSQKRTAESIVKLMDAINKEEDFIMKLEKEESPIKVLLYRFEDMIKIKVDTITSSETKNALMDILDEFGRTVEELEQNG